MNTQDFAQLMQGVGELVQLHKGQAVKGLRRSQMEKPLPKSVKTTDTSDAAIDIKQVRESASVSQAQFASILGVNINTLQNWEQRRNRPRGAAYSLLRLVAHNPRYAIRALA